MLPDPADERDARKQDDAAGQRIGKRDNPEREAIGKKGRRDAGCA
jgi:hypothetical protein